MTVYRLRTVFSKSMVWAGGSGDDAVALNVSFVYGSLLMQYTPNGAGKTVASGWNRTTNTPVSEASVAK